MDALRCADCGRTTEEAQSILPHIPGYPQWRNGVSVRHSPNLRISKPMCDGCVVKAKLRTLQLDELLEYPVTGDLVAVEETVPGIAFHVSQMRRKK